MRKTTIILVFFLATLLGNNIGFSQNSFGCNAQLTVEKNRSIKSVGDNGVFFTLILKNTTNAKKNYSITSNRSESQCKQSSNISSSTYNDTDLDVTFILSTNLNSNASDLNIAIDGNSSQKIYVKVEAPEGTPYNTWSCLAINAKSDNCSTTGAEAILSVYILNPSEE